jgi:hypothetical protein
MAFGQSSFFRVEHSWAALEVVVLSNFVVLVRYVEFLVKNVLKIGLKKWLSPIEPVVHAELIELVEFDEGHSESIKSTFKRVLLPVLEFQCKLFVDELEKVVVTKFVVVLLENSS